MTSLRPATLLLTLLASSAWVVPSCAASTVVDPQTAPAVLTRLAAGDVLRLKPGVYNGLSFRHVKRWDPARPIVITSADPTRPAIVTDFTVRGARGLVFRDVTLHATNPNTRGYGFVFHGCEAVALERVKVHGSLDGDPSNDPYGVQFRDCHDVSVTGSEFTELNRGLLVGPASKVRVEDNRLHLLRSDGMDFAQVQDVRIVGNEIRDIFRVGTDHPDGIQFWTSATTAPSRNILIARNLIDRGRGLAMQGIFIRDEAGHPYDGLTIEDNLILGTGWNALRIVGHTGKPTTGVTIRGNELITFREVDGVPTRELLTYILLQNVNGAEVTANRAAQISFDKVEGLTQRGNVITKPVRDKGAAALANWTARHRPADRIAALPAEELPGAPKSKR
ncbi:right-handed parallel beta-helix repeat-containing protein [Phenylobacterium sp.]|uniref:right-handed parallel beta-helix repeat-containing protein n=1 Tax=Phenylobacterium sp. TaxID=1871053 RepID=UPI00301D2A08